jgi:sulfopyruvate decarboxylase TPP-binding subunit
MDQDAIALTIEAFKEVGINYVVTLPEEPTHDLVQSIREDRHFETVTVPSEGCGIAFCGGASLGGKRCVFITGIAGLLVGSWALSQMGPTFSIPLFIMASYRGDFGDLSGVQGTTLYTFNQVGEPLLQALRIPYRFADHKPTLKRMVRDTYCATLQFDSPAVLLLTGEVLW